MARTRHRSLVERSGRKTFLRDKERPCTHAKRIQVKGKKIRNLKKGFEHIEFPAKVLDYLYEQHQSKRSLVVLVAVRRLDTGLWLPLAC